MRYQDAKTRVDGVINSRPVTTTELVIGKFHGVAVPVFFVTVLLSIAASVLQISFGLPFRIQPHLVYLWLLAFPAICFIVSLVYFLLSVVKSRAVAIILANAYIIVFFIFIMMRGELIPPPYCPLIDYSGFSLSPFYSDLIGFAGLTHILAQRLYIVSLSALFLSVTVCLYPRLPGRRSWALVITVLAALYSIYYNISVISAVRETGGARKEAKAEQKALACRPPTSVSHYDLTVGFREGGRIAVRALLTLRNPNREPITEHIFILNRGLTVTEVSLPQGKRLPFKRGKTTLLLELPPLEPGKELRVSVSYEGFIDSHCLFLDSRHELADLRGISRGNIGLLGHLASYIGGDYTFLVPESRWYPSPNCDYGYKYPEKRPANFATARIRVTVPREQTAISQGKLVKEISKGKEKIFIWESEIPLPKYSVNAGVYEKTGGVFAGVRANLYYHKGHEKNVAFFADVKGEIGKYIEDWFARTTEKTDLTFPFPSISVIEVPSQMRPFSGGWASPSIMVQPGIIMVKETGFFGANFERSYRSRKEKAEVRKKDSTKEKLKIELLKQFFDLDFMGGSIEHNAMPNYWRFRVSTRGSLHPLLDYAINSYISELAVGSRPFHAVYMMENLQKVIGKGIGSYFLGRRDKRREVSWRDAFIEASIDDVKAYEAMTKKPLDDFDPDDDPKLFFEVMNLKGRAFVRMLHEILGPDDFKRLIGLLLERYQYRSFDMVAFRRLAEEVHGQPLGWFFEQWLKSSRLPGFEILQWEAYKIKGTGPGPRYQVLLRIKNGEDAKGFCKVILVTESDTVERKLKFDGDQIREIGFVVPGEPKRLDLDWIFAMNRKNRRILLSIPERERSAVPFDGERIITPTEIERFTVIVDDLDDGFSLQGGESSSFLRPGGGRKELQEFMGFGMPGDRWQVWRNCSGAYGQYNPCLKLKGPGSGDCSATWRSRIKRDGLYEVFTYMGLRRKDILGAMAKIGSNYRYEITHRDGVEVIRFDASCAELGWNSLGTFPFTSGKEVEVVLSDDADGIVAADAIKLVPIRE
jgi:hypothetical protein